MTDHRARRNLLDALTREALDAVSCGEPAPGVKPATLSIDDLVAAAARIPEPSPVQRLEAGPLAMVWFREQMPPAESTPSPMDLLTGVSIVEVGDPPPDGIAPLPAGGWRLVGRDGEVIREGQLTDGE